MFRQFEEELLLGTDPRPSGP